MTTATITTPLSSYFSNLARAADHLAGALFLMKASDFVECFRTARAMSRVVGDEGSRVATRHVQQVRRMAGAFPTE